MDLSHSFDSAMDVGDFVTVELTDEEEALLRAAEADVEKLPDDLYKDDSLDEFVGGADAEEGQFSGPTAAYKAAMRELRKNPNTKRVDLSGLDLLTLDGETVAALQHVEELDLSGNSITRLPSNFSQLENLRTLYLEDNEFDRFPPEVLNLENLEHLDFSRNHLTDLPKAFAKLSKLRRLDINACGLRALPSVICNLPALRSLSVGWNYLESLPESLAECQRLEALTADANGWEDIPPAIWRLSSLKFLSLNGNSIDELPPEVSNLSSLTKLYLGDNSLRGLPLEIGNLIGLEELSVSENYLSVIPSTIGNLRNLTFLDLSRNQIENLPLELSNLPRTLELVLHSNPLPDILLTVADQGTASILTYLDSLYNSTRQYEAKLILVGEGNVGKSTLIAALRGDPFVEGRPTTHGIDIELLSLPHLREPVNLDLNSWDFGGQEVYRITHQFFFSRRAIYLLVWKPREGQEQNNIEEWCSRILLRTGRDARILVVATHADERRSELDYAYLKTKYPDILVGNFAVDSETGRGISELRAAIAAESSRLPQMGELLSNNWVVARDRIVSTARPHMSRLSFERICAQEGLDEESTQTLATLLHDLGHIIHYADDEGLRDLVVLQPEWLTKAIGYVLEDEPTRDGGGVLEHARLREIWSKPRIPGASGYPEEFHPYFLRLMEKFDITYRLPDESASLVAQLVPFERPDPLSWEPFQRDSRTRKLKVVCRTADEAPGLIAWLTVRNHQFSVGRHWRRGVLLVHRQYASQAVLELLSNNRDLVLTVLGPAPEYFFHLLRDGIEELIQRRWKGLGYLFLIPCGRRLDNGRPCTGHFTYHALIKFRQRGEERILCQVCVEWADVSALLTGFGKDAGQMSDILTKLAHAQSANTAVLERIEARAATTASMVRAALKILSTEVTDTPRLFTFVPEDRSRAIRAISTRQYFLLTLWCEAPGAEHKLEEATYRFRPPKAWVQAVGPYLRVVIRVLQAVIPVASVAYGASLSDNEYSSAKADLDLTKVLAEKFPAPEIGSDSGAPESDEVLDRAEGAGLRALRQLLGKLDASSNFGGLRRVRTSSGDLLWVCPEHYRAYDPGLPQLSYTEALAVDELD